MTRYLEVIKRVQRRIEGSLDVALKLEELAQENHLSAFHLHRLFSGISGETLADFGRRLRLERAAQKLAFSSLSVVEVALEAGYSSHEAFTRAFRRQFGQSPSQFRQDPRRLEKQMQSEVTPFQLSQVELRPQPAYRLASMRHTGPYQEVGPTFERFMAWAGQVGLLQSPPRCLGICYDDPDVVEASKIRYDCCLILPENWTGEVIGELHLPAGLTAVLTLRGPYTQIESAYRFLYGVWLPQSGHQLRDHPSYEVFLNSPQLTAPENLLTEIHLPV